MDRRKDVERSYEIFSEEFSKNLWRNQSTARLINRFEEANSELRPNSRLQLIDDSRESKLVVYLTSALNSFLYGRVLNLLQIFHLNDFIHTSIS